jgi:cytochrome oxidase Cu insertion factor (SCO1/SenC/PrrC family)
MVRRRISIALAVAALVVVLAGAFLAVKMRLPKPQTAFVQGEIAPDFTLQDENGQSFHLASARGSRVVLIFYRGYW